MEYGNIAIWHNDSAELTWTGNRELQYTSIWERKFPCGSGRREIGGCVLNDAICGKVDVHVGERHLVQEKKLRMEKVFPRIRKIILRGIISLHVRDSKSSAQGRRREIRHGRETLYLDRNDDKSRRSFIGIYLGNKRHRRLWLPQKSYL